MLQFISTLITFSVLTVSSFAAPTPVNEDHHLNSPEFAEKLYNALTGVDEQKITRIGADVTVKNVAGGLECSKAIVLGSRAKKITKYSCTLIKGRWKQLSENTYSSSDNQVLTNAIYKAIDKEFESDLGDGFQNKTVELNQPDGDGGTERNQLVCTHVSGSARFRPSCQIIDAL